MINEFKVVKSESLASFSDKCILPPSLLQEAITSHETLPHPMVFMLNNEIYVGVREFTAPEGQIHVSEEIWDRLKSESTKCALVLSLPRATSICIRPTHFYPHVTNWKYYLESFLSSQYTTLTEGQKFRHRDSVAQINVELIVDKANAPSVIVVDTDIELDMIPLNDIMAAQQLQQESTMMKYENIPEVSFGARTAVSVEPFNKAEHPSVFKINLSKYSGVIEISISNTEDLFNVDLLCSLDRFITLENFMWSTIQLDAEKKGKKVVSIDLNSDNVVNMRLKYAFSDSFWLYIVPFAWEHNASVEIQARDNLSITSVSEKDPTEVNTFDYSHCQNCHQVIESSKIVLHEAFCFRNTVRCTCGSIFPKAIPATHWHCDQCENVQGESSLFRFKHDKLYHSGPYVCSHCLDETQHASFLDLIQSHRADICPGKPHECQFCHLVLPQGEATFEDSFSNLTHHESECGNKTIECYQCDKVLRNKDFASHMKIHEMIKTERKAEVISKCANVNCVNILSLQENDLGLCATCFGPLYLSTYDPEHKKLQARIERRYVLQLTKGCGNSWCRNQECASGNTQLDFRLALEHVRSKLFTQIATPSLPVNSEKSVTKSNRFWFCVGESMQEKIKLALNLLEEAKYGESMIYKAVAGRHEDSVRDWLEQNA